MLENLTGSPITPLMTIGSASLRTARPGESGAAIAPVTVVSNNTEEIIKKNSFFIRFSFLFTMVVSVFCTVFW